MSERVPVGACRCPRSEHVDGDWVVLASEASIALGGAAQMAIALHGGDPILMQGALRKVYVAYGIEAWSFTDADGDPIPVQHEAVDWADTLAGLLPYGRGGLEVSEAGDRLYSETIIRPYLARRSQRSQPGRTVGPTSATRATGSKHPKPRKRSSRASTAGKLSAVGEQP